MVFSGKIRNKSKRELTSDIKDLSIVQLLGGEYCDTLLLPYKINMIEIENNMKYFYL
jgi:hypothetical protein